MSETHSRRHERDAKGVAMAAVICYSIILVFAVIEGTITSWLVSQRNIHDNVHWTSSQRDRIRYLCFVSWWTVTFCILYIIAFFGELCGGFMGVFNCIASHAIFNLITWVFWLSGAAAYTQSIGGGIRCGHRHFVYCHQMVAVEAFAWIEWILYCAWFAWIMFLWVKALVAHERQTTPMAEV